MICPFCKSQKISKKIKIYSEILKKDVYYCICKSCRSINQDTIPTRKEIKNYYESYIEIKNEMNPGYLNDNQLKPFFEERDKTLKEIGFSAKLIEKGSNVELGCANGQFLKYLKKNSAKYITGIDISEKLINSINIDNINLIVGDFTNLKDSTVDNLYMFNVLEHLDNIDDTMRQILRITREKSNIIIEIPVSGVISYFFNKKWRFLMPDEHLHIPSIKGLKKLLSSYSLEITGFTRFGSGFTTGMINNKLKQLFDFSAKRLKFGDRGAFLIKKKKK